MDPISFFITRPWLLKNPACSKWSPLFIVIINKLFDIPACCSQQNGSYRGILLHP
jgi:hypothetical protein